MRGETQGRGPKTARSGTKDPTSGVGVESQTHTVLTCELDRIGMMRGFLMIRAVCLLIATTAGAIGIGVAAPANAAPSTPFKNCTAAEAAGYCDIPSSSPLYTPSQDRDGDGVACEC